MRQETVNIYTFDELSDQAKEKAREWWLDLDLELAWTAENRQSMEAFCAVFPIQAVRWTYDADFWNMQAKFTGSTDHMVLTGQRLATYLQNNYGHAFSQLKTYRLPSGRERVSKIMQEPTCCRNTGYCMDEALLDNLRAFIKRPDDIDFYDVLSEALDNWAIACKDDAAAQRSPEQVDETIRANEYEFLIDGTRY